MPTLPKSNNLSRRRFLAGTTLGGAALLAGVHSQLLAAESQSPNEKLRLGMIGTASQARFSIENVKHEDIVALCDVDGRFLDKAAQEFSRARTFGDFRKMLDNAELDGVVICTPDHIHAPATAAALIRGKPVYCEKPLTHTVEEARLIAQLAAKHKVPTQMGTQIHAEENYRRVVELIRAGAIGPITEVHTWAGRAWGGGERPDKADPIPKHLDWDLWLGPAPERPFVEGIYHTANWRKWWDFGGGNLADMACHHMDLPFWALGLRYPIKVRAEGPKVHPETCPLGLKVSYEYAAEGNRPALKLHWYDGTSIPEKILDIPTGGGGNLFVGEKGMLRADYGSWKLYPEDKFRDFQPPAPTIPVSVGHHQEWINAIRTGSPTTCNFDYSGALTEAVLLGNVAYRSGVELEWDAAKLTATNHPEAERFIKKQYRKGWELPRG
ncbi:MAG: Gfo/Idh/MocA family oxidoreductase [Pirellulales bacterium]|nr:Gfo/Idh/MocA family oxidoreductase [Pirellulales bacterium]